MCIRDSVGIARRGREKRAVGHERATVAINVTPDTKLVFCDELDQVDVTRGGSDSRVANPAERRRWRGRARQRHHRIGQHLGSRPEKTDPAIDAIHAVSFCHAMRHQTPFPLGERIALHSADAPLNEAQCRYERLGTRQRPNSGIQKTRQLNRAAAQGESLVVMVARLVGGHDGRFTSRNGSNSVAHDRVLGVVVSVSYTHLDVYKRQRPT